MRAVWLLSAITIAGCYDPAVRDCTITCAAAGDCAAGQVCGPDNFCAAPDVAGTCRSRGADAAPPTELHLVVQGPGTLADSSGTRTCNGDCTFDVTPGATVTLIATPLDGKELDRWTTTNCAVKDVEHPGLTCSVMVVPPITTVGARFK